MAGADLLLVLDAAGTVRHVAGRDTALLTRLRAGWIGRTLADTVTVDTREKAEQLRLSLTQPEPGPARHLNHALPGEADLPVLYRAVPLPGDAAGHWLALGRDLRDTLTLQRRLIEAQQTMERDHWRYREAETRFRSLFLTSAEAVLVAEAATLRVLEANPAALGLLETIKGRKGKVTGVGLATLFEADAAEALAEAAAAARSLGRHERLRVTLADAQTVVVLAIAAFQQDSAAYLLVRLLHETEGATRRPGAAEGGDATPLEAAFVRHASDALVFTDTQGRVRAANRSFARLAQLGSESQAVGEPLDRWLGRSGIELQVLLANLREGGTPGLLATEMRGALGLFTEVEVAASSLETAEGTTLAFSLRDVGRRLAPGEDALPRVPASVKQLSELVGRVPLKQIVSETSDLIERLSIEAALQMTRDNRALAAQMLGLSRQSLYVKLHRYSLGGMGGGAEDAEEA